LSDISNERKIRDMSSLLEIAKAMSVEKDLYALLDLIIEKVKQVVDADRASLYLVDSETDELWTRVVTNLEIREIRLPIGTGIAGHVAATQQIENIEDVYDDDRFDRQWDERTGYRTRSMLCVPLLTHEDKVVGVIQVLNKESGPFTDYDIELLGALGSHAAISLDNAQLMQHYLEKQKMQQSLDIARDIQQGLLPDSAPDVEGLDIAGWSHPCDQTGGDYFDFIPLADNRLGVVIGDVASHGIGPALLMTASRATLRALVTTTDDVAEMMARVNDRLSEDMEEGRFITLFYGMIDPIGRAVRYTSAGHEPAILFRAATGEFEQLLSTGFPLGIMGEAEFPEGPATALESGDVLVLTTDGIIEATNEDGEEFGRDRLREVIVSHSRASAQSIIEAIYAAVCNYCGEAEQKDDITLVALKAL